jgi:hypothetical protein
VACIETADILPTGRHQFAGAADTALLVLVIGRSRTVTDFLTALTQNPAIERALERVRFRSHQVGRPQ